MADDEIQTPDSKGGIWFLKGVAVAIPVVIVDCIKWDPGKFWATVLFFLIIVIAYQIQQAAWYGAPAGQAYQAEVARQQAEAARLAHEQYLINMRAIITNEYRERTGDPYAEVPEAWMLYCWNELENEAAADERQRQLMAQQDAIAFQQGFQSAFNTGQIINAINHQNDPHRR